ncbi:hypothetical protein ABZY16_38720, partial [Streptomyces sp. NPDC006553]|uniref:hypothetical protein n=1 Tax=Streptomyces sp. NPDC006553 TaxID=3157180 RepID=UPI0033AA7336
VPDQGRLVPAEAELGEDDHTGALGPGGRIRPSRAGPRRARADWAGQDWAGPVGDGSVGAARSRL